MPRSRVYREEEYKGEFNLVALERRILVRELKKTQSQTAAADLIKCSARAIADKIYSHQIQDSEWKDKNIPIYRAKARKIHEKREESRRV